MGSSLCRFHALGVVSLAGLLSFPARLKKACTLADVIGQSLDLRAQSLYTFCTLCGVGQSVDRRWTKSGVGCQESGLGCSATH